MRLWTSTAIAVCLPLSLSAQHSKQFVQAELLKTVKAKSAKAGDAVKARTVIAATLPGGVTLPGGTILLGQVLAANPTSLTIAFEQAEVHGKQTPVNLAIRAAMMPGGPAQASGQTQGAPAESSSGSQRPVAAQTGSVIGMPGVTLEVELPPQHAAKFESSNKELQLKQGLQLMLAVPE